MFRFRVRQADMHTDPVRGRSRQLIPALIREEPVLSRLNFLGEPFSR
jgi:hypothetical protein